MRTKIDYHTDSNYPMRFHPDELRDQFAHEERNGLDDLTDARAAMWVIVYIVASAALFLALCIAVWAYWPSQVPLTCQSYIGGEVVACAEGV